MKYVYVLIIFGIKNNPMKMQSDDEVIEILILLSIYSICIYNLKHRVIVEDDGIMRVGKDNIGTRTIYSFGPLFLFFQEIKEVK